MSRLFKIRAKQKLNYTDFPNRVQEEIWFLTAVLHLAMFPVVFPEGGGQIVHSLPFRNNICLCKKEMQLYLTKHIGLCNWDRKLYKLNKIMTNSFVRLQNF